MTNSRAIVFPTRGKAEIREIQVPAPGQGEVLVHSAGCGVCQMEVRKFKGIGDVTYPADRLGHEGVGYIAAVGPGVQGLREGDLVTTLWYPAFQEYTLGRAQWAYKLAPAPADQLHLLISEPAACVLNGATAAAVEPADKVCVCGAGYMGQLLLQLLRRTLCSQLVAVDLDPARLALARTMGATHTINPRETNLVEYASSLGGFDAVIEATGAPGMILTAARMARARGRIVVFGDLPHHAETVDWNSFRCKQLIFANPLYNRDFTQNWRQAVDLITAGVIDQRPLITHIAPAEQCQTLMEAASKPADGYIKGYVSWR